MFKRPRLSAQSFPVNAAITGFLLFYAASCSGPQEPAQEAATSEDLASEPVESPEPRAGNFLPAVWSTRELDAPIRSIGIAGGAGSTFAVAYEGGGLQIFDFDGERITDVSDHDVTALGEGRYAMLSGTPVTVFPGIDATGSLKVWIHGGGLAEAIQYDLQGEQAGDAAVGLCSAPATEEDELLRLAYWTSDSRQTLYVGTIRQTNGELTLESVSETAADAPITACTFGADGVTTYAAPVTAAASLRRRGRDTVVYAGADGDISLKLGSNEPVQYEITDGITIVAPDQPDAIAATGDARGGGYPGGVIVIGGSVGTDDHRAVLIDPSRVTMTAIEVP